jgi:hypothetical protein
MNTLYTIEDLIVLNNIVDVNRDNPNLHYPLKSYEDEYGIHRLFSKEDIEKNTCDFILNAFIKFFTPDWGVTILPTILRLFNEEPLDEMPMYIGNKSNCGLVARWRLQIGK